MQKKKKKFHCNEENTFESHSFFLAEQHNIIRIESTKKKSVIIMGKPKTKTKTKKK